MAQIRPIAGSRAASNTDTSSYGVTITSVSGALVIATCVTRMASGGGPNTPTISDTAGNSWTSIGSCTESAAGGDQRLTAFWCIANASGSTTITFDLNSQNQQACVAWADQFFNVDTSDPLTETNLQTQDLTAAASTTMTLPNAKAKASNIMWGAVSVLTSTAPTVIATGTAGQFQLAPAAASDTIALGTVTNPDGLTIQVSHANQPRCSIAIEINHDNSGLAGGPLVGARLIR